MYLFTILLGTILLLSIKKLNKKPSCNKLFNYCSNLEAVYNVAGPTHKNMSLLI